MIFLGSNFLFSAIGPSWLGAGSSDIILKGDHPSTTNLAKFSHGILQNQIFTLVAARPTFVYVRCVVSTVLNTALRPLDLVGWSILKYIIRNHKAKCFEKNCRNLYSIVFMF
jgi:hypothetical protein